MKDEPPYNPLDKTNLGVSVAEALLAKPVVELPPPEAFNGAGVYAIYYVGAFPPYKRIAMRNRDKKFEMPIYVGKAIPKGARKGGFGLPSAVGAVLHGRLEEHADSIRQCTPLALEDFHCRYLVTDDIWIPLAESLLIKRFSPIWNRVLDGFGNHDPGKGRYKQQRSPWDMVHKGRPWAERCKPHARSAEEHLAAIKQLLEATVPD